MSQIRVSTVATTAGVVNATTSTSGFTLENKPIISGQVGTTATFAGDQLVPFDEFWVQRGITYNSSTRRFTVPVAGIYRITMNPFTSPASAGFRLLVGINTDSPTIETHRGHCYKANAEHDTLSINSIVSLNANDYIVFRLLAGHMYNIPADRFNQFTIERIA
jgi:hypothetical protein